LTLVPNIFVDSVFFAKKSKSEIRFSTLRFQPSPFVFQPLLKFVSTALISFSTIYFFKLVSLIPFFGGPTIEHTPIEHRNH